MHGHWIRGGSINFHRRCLFLLLQNGRFEVDRFLMTAGHGGLMMLVKLKRVDGVFDAFIDENSARVLLKLEKNKVSCIMRSNN